MASRLDAVAFLEFLAAPAVAGIVSADLRLRAHDRGALELRAVDEDPATAVLTEERALAVVDLDALQLVTGNELDDPDLVFRTALVRAEDFETEPLRLLRPGFGVAAIDFTAAIGIVGLDDVVHVARGVSRVASTHQRLGRLGQRFPRQQGTAARL